MMATFFIIGYVLVGISFSFLVYRIFKMDCSESIFLIVTIVFWPAAFVAGCLYYFTLLLSICFDMINNSLDGWLDK